MTTTSTKTGSSVDTALSLKLLRGMVLIRRFEEKCVELYSAGKIRGFLHLYIGEEAVAVGSMPMMSMNDNVVSTYREHGHALARGISAGSIMAEMFGKVNGCSHGRGGSMHLFDKSKKFYGGNAIVGGSLPLAVGLALADKMQRKPAITACYFGDGAVAEGEFHESMNLAALWQLPVLFICENNFYAMGTALSRHQSQTDIAKKAAAYAVESRTVDGMDVMAVRDAAAESVEFVRTRQRPFLLVAETYRFRAHSMYDPDLYRTAEEIEAWKKRCPIEAIKSILRDRSVTEDEFTAIEDSVERDVAEAVAFAEAGEVEPPSDLTKNVYSPNILSAGKRALIVLNSFSSAN